MTYCLGMKLDAGLIMLADTRTNAGLDQVSCYRKLHCLVADANREIHVASSGNLSASQTALDRLTRKGGALGRPPSMFEAAERVGEALREANTRVDDALASGSGRSSASLLLGGRIDEEEPRLFLIYAEGNFIECRSEIPFLQIGETKYGRPILDRVIRHTTPLPAAIKTALLSFDSAMRSNAAIARPIDLVVMPSDPAEPSFAHRFEADDAYFDALSGRWSQILHEATDAIPDPVFDALDRADAPDRPDQIRLVSGG